MIGSKMNGSFLWIFLKVKNYPEQHTYFSLISCNLSIFALYGFSSTDFSKYCFRSSSFCCVTEEFLSKNEKKKRSRQLEILKDHCSNAYWALCFYFKLILSSPKFLIPFYSMTLASLLAPSSPMLFQLNKEVIQIQISFLLFLTSRYH